MMVSLPLEGKFAVPNNLFVIGTMNSSDKSISLIDAVLRRRFEFIEMEPMPEMISDSILRKFIHCSAEDLPAIMNRNVIPLLYEYFYDDEAKVRKALDRLSGTDFEPDSTASGRIHIRKKGE